MKQHRFFASLALGPLVLAAASCTPEPGDQTDSSDGVGTAQSAMTICPGNTTVLGVDVSYYQGDIDWGSVANTSVKFAIARKSDGTFLDTKFQQNWDGIKQAGLIRGVYQYFEPDDDVATQAQIVIDAVGTLGARDLPAMIDVEAAGNLSNAAYAAEIGQWLDLVEAGTGKRPMIYTGKYFWQGNVASSAYNDSALVHAAYPNACYSATSTTFVAPLDCWMGSCPNIADQFDDWQFWQYTSEGKVAGIPGRLDMDIFNGDMAALELLAGGGYAAALVSIDVPSTMVAGETVTAHVTFKNVGSQTWDESTKLGTTSPRDRSSDFADASWEGPNRAAHATMSVAPGDTYTFDFPMHAPKAGAYEETFGLVEEGVTWFADQGGPADDAVKLDLQVVDAPQVTGSVTSAAAGTGSGGAGGGDPNEPLSKATCDCDAAGADPSSPVWAALGLLGAGVMVARRRRSSAGEGSRSRRSIPDAT
jgi:lysozyme